MGAHMDHRMDALASEPEIKRDIGMAGNAREVVIIGVAMLHLAALGLHGDDGIAKPDSREMKLAVANLRIVLGLSPGIRKIVVQRLRKSSQRVAIVGHAPGQRRAAKRRRNRLQWLDIETGTIEIAK